MKKNLLLFVIFLAILAYVFRSLLLNITTNLVDWRDYAVIAWTINQNINHLRSLDLPNLFNTNAFYPHTNTIFLSDTLLTQALVGIPYSFFTRNPIALFNLIFFTTFILNYISSFLFLKRISKNAILAFTGSLAVIFSAFFYSQIGHFQMQSYWPFLLILYLLFGPNNNKVSKYDFIIGLLVAIQFLASVYIAFFALFTTSLFFLLKAIETKNYKIQLMKLATIVLIFALLDGVFIKGYGDAKKVFGIQRNLGEYVTYSAHITDYLFPSQNGILYNNPVIKKWLTFDKHLYGEVASFPGIMITTLAVLEIIKIKKSKNEFSFHFPTEFIFVFFLAVSFAGFLFSLGPRANFNGSPGYIPLPYALFIKYFPFFDAVRGVARWAFILYLGLTYFALNYVRKIKNSRWFYFLVALIILDVLPGKFITNKDSYITPNDMVLRSICANKKTVILEFPVTHFDATGGIAVGLSYITKRQLASLYNKCYLVNGYSGYDLPSIQNIKNSLSEAILVNDPVSFMNTLKTSQANLLVVNEGNVPPESIPGLNAILTKLQKKGQIDHVNEGVFRIN